MRLSSLRAELDITTQAVKLSTSSQDRELETLIRKWRGVSRDVAEELYASAREKVNRMGGVGVWKERSKRRPWDDEEKPEGGEDGVEVEKEEEEAEEEEEEEEEEEVSFVLGEGLWGGLIVCGFSRLQWV